MDIQWIAAIAVIVLVGLISTYRSTTARRFYNRSEQIRKAGSIVVGSLIALVFLASGDPLRILIGILILAVGALYLFIERPWSRI